MKPTCALVASALLLLAACSGDPAPAPAGGPAAAPIRTAGGGHAFARHDVPLEQVLAESRSTGRPALLYFWASW